jgi:hypothetical protein
MGAPLKVKFIHWRWGSAFALGAKSWLKRRNCPTKRIKYSFGSR